MLVSEHLRPRGRQLQQQDAAEHFERHATGMKIGKFEHVMGQVGVLEADGRGIGLHLSWIVRYAADDKRLALNSRPGLGHEVGPLAPQKGLSGVVLLLGVKQELLHQDADADADEVGVVAADFRHRLHQRAPDMTVLAQAILVGAVRQVDRFGQLGAGQGADPLHNARHRQIRRAKPKL
jgi:hypothetical protein